MGSCLPGVTVQVILGDFERLFWRLGFRMTVVRRSGRKVIAHYGDKDKVPPVVYLDIVGYGLWKLTDTTTGNCERVVK